MPWPPRKLTAKLHNSTTSCTFCAEFQWTGANAASEDLNLCEPWLLDCHEAVQGPRSSIKNGRTPPARLHWKTRSCYFHSTMVWFRCEKVTDGPRSPEITGT